MPAEIAHPIEKAIERWEQPDAPLASWPWQVDGCMDRLRSMMYRANKVYREFSDGNPNLPANKGGVPPSEEVTDALLDDLQEYITEMKFIAIHLEQLLDR